jgi:carbonic anhydrase
VPTSRRTFLRASSAAAAGLAVVNQVAAQTAPAAAPPAAPAAAPARPATRPNADEALKMLQEGNARFVGGKGTQACRTPADFSASAAAQYPFAVVVTCADSRVSPEILFDQGVGDLFVVRVAGNVVAGSGALVKGSIEYGVAELGAPLIVVLGHSNCGALKAAIQHIDKHDSLPGSINGLVELIKPAVARVRKQPGDLLDNAIRANVDDGVKRLKTLKPIVAAAVAKGSVKVVGGVYDLASGKITMVG